MSDNQDRGDQGQSVLVEDSEAIVQWQPNHRQRSGAVTVGTASGGVIAASAAVGALAIGALAIGALAIGTLVIGRLTVGRVRLREVHIDNLIVRRASGL